MIQVFSMCQAFSDIGLNTVLVTPNSESNRNLKACEYIKNNFGINPNFNIVEERTIPKNRVAKYVFTNYLDNIISKIGPDLCYVRSSRVMIQCYNKKIPFIFESHNSSLHSRFPLVDRYFKRRFKKAAKSSSFLKLVTISENLKNYWLTEGIPPEKVLAYHDGFPESKYENPVSISKARKLLNIKSEDKIAIYTGKLSYGIDNIIFKLAKVLKEVTFLVVGGPSGKAHELKKKAKNEKLTNINVIGPVAYKQIPLYQYSADILLGLWSKKMSYIDSISPLKLFEYMAAGRIIVAHGFPTIKEVLCDEQNALLANPDSFDNLVYKVKKASEINYPSLLAENAHKEAFDKYSWNQRAKKIIESI